MCFSALALSALVLLPAAPLADDDAVTIALLDAVNPVREMPNEVLGHDVPISFLKTAPDPEKARLGRWLFFDGRLSGDSSVSCATCHIPEFGFSEPTPVSTGIRGQRGARKAPSFINAVWAFYPETFWDGRAADLEEQAIGPIANPIEMGSTHDVAVKSIAELPNYRPFFERAFGDREVTLDRVAEAIAHYERTRVSGNSRYDQWRELDDEDDAELWATLLSEEERLGEELFFGKALCATCHTGTSFTDSRYHNLGVGWDAETETFADIGRFEVTGEEVDKGAFKTPGLREVTLRAPYMHDGSEATLRDVMELYNKGGNANPWLSPKMKPLNLSEPEIDAIIAFMHAIEGEGYMDSAPARFP
ncbi:MAG: hypothetical protein DHS20C15_28120 [Planctomycetota bacterium]|nr:MAG: hypothetical protein DHS20C15_28120 [Planctomycetota bacterium]